MKISELTSKTFLSNAGAAANSYVLINYEDNSTSEPVTYKTSLNTLGKAIAENLNLVGVDNYNHLTQMSTSQGNYALANPDVGIDTEIALISSGTIKKPKSAGNTAVYRDFDLKKAVFVNTSEGKLYYSDGSQQRGNITSIDGKPLVVYDTTAETIKYYNTTENEYVGIPTGSSGPTAGAVICNVSESAYTLSYYDSTQESYETIPLYVGPSNRQAVYRGEGSLDNLFYYTGESFEFMRIGIVNDDGRIVYDDGGITSAMAIADPTNIPGDESHEFFFVVSDVSGHLYKILSSNNDLSFVQFTALEAQE